MRRHHITVEFAEDVRKRERKTALAVYVTFLVSIFFIWNGWHYGEAWVVILGIAGLSWAIWRTKSHFSRANIPRKKHYRSRKDNTWKTIIIGIIVVVAIVYFLDGRNPNVDKKNPESVKAYCVDRCGNKGFQGTLENVATDTIHCMCQDDTIIPPYTTITDEGVEVTVHNTAELREIIKPLPAG